jgi:hypothetical protein
MNYSPQFPVDFTYIYTSPVCSLHRQNISCLLLPLCHTYILDLMLESLPLATSYCIMSLVGPCCSISFVPPRKFVPTEKKS